MTALARVNTVTTGWTGGPGLNTLYFRGAGGSPTAAEVSDVVARVRAFWNALSAFFPAAWACQVQGVVPIINADSGVLQSVTTVTTPTLVTGGAGGVFGPTQTAVVMRLTTATVFGGRRVLGRQYLGPVRDSQTGVSAPGAALTNAVVTAGVQLAPGATSAALVVWHRPHQGLSDGNFGDVVLPVSVNPNWGVRRSRRD